MIEAWEMCRKGQFFWDFVSAENGIGFHNPVKAMDTLVPMVDLPAATMPMRMMFFSMRGYGLTRPCSSLF